MNKKPSKPERPLTPQKFSSLSTQTSGLNLSELPARDTYRCAHVAARQAIFAKPPAVAGLREDPPGSIRVGTLVPAAGHPGLTPEGRDGWNPAVPAGSDAARQRSAGFHGRANKSWAELHRFPTHVHVHVRVWLRPPRREEPGGALLWVRNQKIKGWGRSQPFLFCFRHEVQCLAQTSGGAGACPQESTRAAHLLLWGRAGGHVSGNGTQPSLQELLGSSKLGVVSQSFLCKQWYHLNHLSV